MSSLQRPEYMMLDLPRVRAPAQVHPAGGGTCGTKQPSHPPLPESPEGCLIRSTLTLDTLPEDLLRLIAAESLLQKGSLRRLSQTSRHIRSICMPILFSRCFAHPGGQKGVPPLGIRPYVRHITYINYRPIARTYSREDIALYGYPGKPVDHVYGVELDYLPALRSVSLRCSLNLAHLELMKKCLAHCGLTSINLTPSVRWCGGHPDPRVDSPYPPNITITHLSHAPSVWREIFCELERRNISAEIALESHCIALLALGINRTAEVLSLPLETSPLARMSELFWPHLRELSLCGRYILPSQSTSIHRLLARTPSLRKLSVEGAQPYSLRLARAPILGRNPANPIDLPDLRTLVVAYPDPEDAIFSISSTNISHLSLRDWPRYYFHQDLGDMLSRWATPLLTASECLSILRRMSLHYLENLELVYRVDHADDVLIHYIASAFPRLARLELHRYRSGGEDVPYKHIATLLAPIRTLHVLNLNLDFPESTGPRTSCLRQHSDPLRHTHWIELAQARGVEMADIVEAGCPGLKWVALLMHDPSGSYWWKFRPSTWPGERVDYNRWDAESDFEPFPLPWGKRD